MRETLLQYGWTFQRSCNCGGTHQEFWRKTGHDIEVHIYTKMRKFYIKSISSGRNIGQQSHDYQLAAKLDELN
jgi:hypothetical protein